MLLNVRYSNTFPVNRHSSRCFLHLNLHERVQPSPPSICNEPSESDEKQNHTHNATDKEIRVSSKKAVKTFAYSSSRDRSIAWAGHQSRKGRVALTRSEITGRIYEELPSREQIPLYSRDKAIHQSMDESDDPGYFNEINHFISLRSTKEYNMDPKLRNSRDRSIKYKIADDDGDVLTTTFAFSILCTILFAII
uniref:Uncharacterized protein n=1 Tax=Parascaris univalens TaxID=6257 RepID=A0A915C5B7_PARUN